MDHFGFASREMPLSQPFWTIRGSPVNMNENSEGLIFTQIFLALLKFILSKCWVLLSLSILYQIFCYLESNLAARQREASINTSIFLLANYSWLDVVIHWTSANLRPVVASQEEPMNGTKLEVIYKITKKEITWPQLTEHKLFDWDKN